MVKTPVLYKSLVVGVILLFIISTIGPVVIGYNIKSDIIINESSSDKSPAIRWEKRFGGDHANDECESVRQTSDNGYILCGWSNYYNPFGWYDAWLVKTDENGEMIWEESYGIYDPNGLDIAYSVEQTSDGGYIFSGDNNDGAWLCKINDIGDVEWSKTFYNEWRFFSVQQAPDGGYITAGDYPVLIKTYPNGTVQWRRTWSFPGLSLATDVDVTDDNGFIITGFFDPDVREVFLIKVDSNGVEEFKKTFAWKDHSFRAESVEQTSDGGYILVGTAYSSTSPSPVVLIKTDSEGNETWNRTYYSSYGDRFSGEEVQQTSDGGYIIIAQGIGSCSWLIKTDENGNIEWDILIGDFYYALVGLVSVQQTTDGGYILGGIAVDDSVASWLDYYIMKIDMVDSAPPDKPEMDGPSSGRIYVTHTFTASTTDPDGDDVYFIFDWRDGSYSEWLGPYKSGEEITASHRWTTTGTGLLKVRAKDIHGVMSEWSDPFEFTVPHNRIYNNLWLFRLLERIPTLEKLLNLFIK